MLGMLFCARKPGDLSEHIIVWFSEKTEKGGKNPWNQMK